MSDLIQPWSTTRPDGPVDLPSDLADKNARLLNPLAAPDLYYELYDNAASKVVIKDPETGQETNYELVKNVNNSESGFHAKIIKNPETGHHILIAKGMDMPFRDEGGGTFGFRDDLGDLDEAQTHGCITDQVVAAEAIYLELLQDSDIKTIEMIGYSIGSIPANYMSSIYSVPTTNIADLGTPERIMSSVFDACAHGLFPGAHGEFKTNLDNNVIGLELRLDAAGGWLGGAGPRHGKRIALDQDSLNPIGFAHIPDIYATSAREQHNAPETTVTETLKKDTWKPF